ncbi:MAG: cytochrome c family protein [Geminicoccaceae bacterium]
MLKACMLGCAITLATLGPALADGDAANGEKIFKRCAACHATDGTTNRIGPHLGGVVGRTAGSVEGFKYSESMIQHGKDGLVWSNETLSSYLEDPKGFIPKNKMAFPGLKKPEERADVIAYLDTLSAK